MAAQVWADGSPFHIGLWDDSQVPVAGHRVDAAHDGVGGEYAVDYVKKEFGVIVGGVVGAIEDVLGKGLGVARRLPLYVDVHLEALWVRVALTEKLVPCAAEGAGR